MSLFKKKHFFAKPKKRYVSKKARDKKLPKFGPKRELFKRLGIGNPSNLRLRGIILAGIILISFASMVARLWDLQVLNSSEYKAAVVANVLRTAIVPAARGLIYDRSGDVLVNNQVVQEITLDRSFVKPDSNVYKNLSVLLGVPVSQVLLAAENPNYNYYQPVPIAVGATLAQVTYIKEHPDLFPGVNIELTTVRSYPYGSMLAQTLGYVGPITQKELKMKAFAGYSQQAIVGQSGLEAYYEKWLQGQPGKTTYVVNSRGQIVGILSKKLPKQGDSLVTSIDLGLQQVLDNALAQQIQTDRSRFDPIHGIYPAAPGGAAVVMDVRTGQILALSSYPSYNPSVWVGGISETNYQALTNPNSGYPLLNRVIQGLYTPGSVFKLATATAALVDGLISPYYTYDDATGTFTIPNCSGRCVFHDDDSQAMGVIGISKAIAASDDVFFYNLGYQFYVRQAQFGPMPIQQMANLYGMGELTGIDLPGEAQGMVDSALARKEHPYLAQGWYPGDQIEMAFGQGGTLITPIQLAVAYGTFANGGNRMQPHIVKYVVNSKGQIVYENKPVIVDHINIPSQDYSVMLAGFEGAVTAPYGTVGGTGLFDSFPISSYPIAGKTGTASIGNNKEPNANFVAFGPANDPKYVVAVMIEQAGYGATAAAPVALKVFQYLISHQIPPIEIPK
jgi:penicillin-binding protein 2